MNMAAVTSRHAPHLSRGHRHQMHVAWQAKSAVHSCQAGPCDTMPCPAQLGAAQQHRSISNLPQQQCWRTALVHDAQQRPYLVQPLVLSACAAALCLWQACAALPALAVERDIDTFENIPGQLRSDGDAQARLGSFLEGGKRKEVESCTRKCVPTCIRGGEGAPGLGPISMRRDVVVFKEGFRSRSYCLRECVEVCSLSINAPAKAAASGP